MNLSNKCISSFCILQPVVYPTTVAQAPYILCMLFQGQMSLFQVPNSPLFYISRLQTCTKHPILLTEADIYQLALQSFKINNHQITCCTKYSAHLQTRLQQGLKKGVITSWKSFPHRIENPTPKGREFNYLIFPQPQILSPRFWVSPNVPASLACCYSLIYTGSRAPNKLLHPVHH